MRPDTLALLVCPRSGGPLDVETIEVHPDGTIEFGLLHSDATTYPIVEGIPVFTGRTDTLVDLVRSGRLQEATAAAAFGDVEMSRWTPLLDACRDLRPLRRPAALVASALHRRRLEQDQRALRGRSGVPRPEDVIGRAYLRSRRPSVDAYNYFVHRYGIPRHLVGLSFIETALPDRPAVDVGCGAGHLTAALARRVGAPVIGVDPTFFLALVGRRHLAPQAEFVCANALALPMRSGVAGTVFSSDVLPYVTEKWSAVRECARVLADDGRLLFTSLRNSRARHVYGGETLSPAGWDHLVAPLPRRTIPDGVTLARYLRRLGVPAGTSFHAADLESEQTLSLIASRDPAALVDHDRFDSWPHARGTLGLNPLYAPVESSGRATVYRRTWPSETYARDNAAMAEYLPEIVTLPHEAVAAARQGGAHPVLDDLIASVAVLEFPDGYPRDPWPGV